MGRHSWYSGKAWEMCLKKPVQAGCRPCRNEDSHEAEFLSQLSSDCRLCCVGHCHFSSGDLVHGTSGKGEAVPGWPDESAFSLCMGLYPGLPHQSGAALYG